MNQTKPIKVSYRKEYNVPTLKATPTYRKPKPVHQAMEHTGLAMKTIKPKKATREDLLLVHRPRHVDAFITGEPKHLAGRSGLPWSPEFRDAVLYMNGAEIEAGRNALEDGISANLASGFHHAYARSGGSFCTFNGLAVAIKKLREEGKIHRAAVVDCDAHFGNGTSSIFRDDEFTLTYSIFGPFGCIIPEKDANPVSDIARSIYSTEQEPNSEEYLESLKRDIRNVVAFQPDIVFYQAGADPYKKDPLGMLRLSIEELAERDKIVFEALTRAHIPVAYNLAGGYTHDMDDITDIHVNTFHAAHEAMKKNLNPSNIQR